MSRDSALYLADFRWDRTHIHLFQFFNRCERIQEFGYEGIVLLLAVLRQWCLRHDGRLIVGWRVIVLFLR